MSAQKKYFSSILAVFSTYAEKVGATESVTHTAVLGLISFFKQHPIQNWNALAFESYVVNNQSSQIFTLEAKNLLLQFVRTYPPYQTSVFLHEYLLALNANNCSPATIKNYRSDINQFLVFTAQTKILKAVTKPNVAKFIEFQAKENLKESSIRRKLVSITQFALWLQRKELIFSAAAITALESQLTAVLVKKPLLGKLSTLIPEVVNFQKKQNKSQKSLTPTPVHTHSLKTSALKSQDFRARLNASIADLQKVVAPQVLANNTTYPALLNAVLFVIFGVGLAVLGYNQFIKNASQPLAYPTTPTRPNRFLQFQGRLTDTSQNPITTATNMAFRLYDDPSAGTLLWNSGTCSVTPDQDGIFNTDLGDDCGSEIGSDVFSENSNVWLEVQIASETLSPRQSIKTVPFALNSETLQGYPIDATSAATVNTVVTMDSYGDIVLGEVSPTIRSVSGTFSIEAQTLSLQTSSGSNGNIVLDPDGTGRVNILSDLATTGYIAAPGATFSATYAGGIPLIARGGPSGTANIQEWQNSAGTALSVVSSSGNIGIGTATPSQVLDVNGDLRIRGNDITDSADTIRISLGATTTLTNTTTTLSGTTALTASSLATLTTSATVNWAGATSLTFSADNATINGSDAANGDITIDGTSNGTKTSSYVILQPTSGNVGIGSTSPGATLDVTGSGRFSTDITVTGGDITGANSAAIDVGEATSGDIEITGDLLPATDATYDVGSTAKSWKDGYFTGQICFDDSDCASTWASLGVNYWRIASGTVSPVNDTLDLLVGSNATASAKVALLNINSGTPTASISANSGNNATTLSGLGVLGTTNRQTLTLGSSTTGNIALAPFGSTAMTLLSNGNVGIGSVSPTQELDVNGNIFSGVTGTASDINFLTSDNNSGLYGTAAGSLGLSSNGSQRLFISGAEFSIKSAPGTSDDSALVLEKDGSWVDGEYLALGWWEEDGSADLARIAVEQVAANDYRMDFYTTTSGTGGVTNRMSIDHTGNVGIGSTNPTQVLDVNGDIRVQGNDITDSGDTARISLGATTTLTNSTTTLSGTTTLTASSLATLTSSASVAWGGATSLTFSADNATIYGSDASNGDITIHGTSDSTRTTSYVLLQPTAGNVGIGSSSPGATLDVTGSGRFSTDLTVTGGDITGANSAAIDIGEATSGDIEITGDLLPATDATYDLGSTTKSWRNIYLTGNLCFDDSDCASTWASLTDNYWRISSGAISTVNDTLDLLVGSNATASAKVALLNINSGTPTASISANSGNNATYLTGTGILSTTNAQTLSVGGTGTGNITLNPGGSTAVTLLTNGNIGIGSVSPTQVLDVNGDIRVQGNDITDSGNTTRISLGATTTLTNTTTTLSGTTALTASSLATLTTSATVDWAGATSLTFSADNAAVYGSDASGGDLTLNGTSNGTKTASYINLQTGGGNVGIGTTTPGAIFQVNGGGTGVETLNIRANSSADANIQEWQDSSGTALSVIDEIGWVGIGTTNPAVPVDVRSSAGNSTLGAIYASYVSSYTGGSTQTAGAFSVQGIDSAASAYTGASGNAQTGSGTTYTLSGLTGLQGSALYQGTGGTLTNATGVAATFTNSGAGTITYGNGVNVNMYLSGAGNVAVGHGFRLQTVSDTGGGSFQTLYGMYLTAITAASSNNYGIWGEAGDWILDEDGDGAAGGTSGGGNIILGEGQDLELYHDGTNSYIMNNTGDLYIGDTATDDVILSANGGNVAIGTTDPTAKLHIVGGNGTTARVDTSGAGQSAKLELSEAGTSKWQFSNFGSSNDILVISGDGGLGTDDFLTINQSGNVGVGTTGPSALFAVGASSQFTVSSTGDVSTAGGDITGANSAAIDIGEATSGDVEVTGDLLPATDDTYDLGSTAKSWQDLYLTGNLCFDDSSCVSTIDGISNYWRISSGTVSPVNNTLDLLVGSNATASAKIALLNINSGTPTASISANSGNNATTLSGLGVLGTTNMQSLTLGNSTTGNIVIAPAGSTAITVLQNGNVGIGTTAPNSKLRIAAATTSTDGIILKTTDDSTTNYLLRAVTSNGSDVNRVLIGAKGQVGISYGDAATGNAASTPNYTALNVANSSVTSDPSASVFGASFTTRKSYISNHDNYALYATMEVNGGGTSTDNGVNAAARYLTQTIGSSDTNVVYGQYNHVRHYTSDNTGTAIGVYSVVDSYGAGTFGTAEGVRIGVGGGSGTQPTSAYGVRILDINQAVTNNYALLTNAGDVIFNEGGDSASDFRVETDTDANALFTNASTNNVGIGTSTPGRKLDVAGDIELANYLYFGNAGTEYYRWDGSDFISSDDILPASDGGSSLGSDSVRWDSLYVKGASIHLGNSGDETIIGYNPTTDVFGIDPDGDATNEFVIQDDGNVGIGSTSPGRALDVTGGVRISSGLSLTNGVIQGANSAALDIGAATSGDIEATGDLLPATDNTYDLGSTSKSWQDLFLTGTLCFDDSDCISAFSGISNYWRVASGTISPINDTLDLFVGGSATSSAKFALLNMNSGTPTASVSANSGNNATTLSGLGVLGTTNRQTLTLGSSVTGNVEIAPFGSVALSALSNGNVGIGTANPAQALDINGDVRVRGNDISDSTSTTRITLGATTTLTNTTTTLSGTTDLTASSLSTLTTSASVAWAGATSLTFSADNATIYGSDASGGDLTLNGTSNATKTSSHVNIQTTGGNVGIGTTAPVGILNVTGAAIGKAMAIFNETGDQDIMTASVSGTTRYRLSTEGYSIAERFADLSNTTYYVDPAASGVAGIFAGNVGMGDTTPDAQLEIIDTTEQLRLTHTDGVDESSFAVDTDGNLTIDNTGTKTIIADDLQISGNDILDSGATTRISLGATTTLTNTTTTLSGTTALTASSLATLTTSASVDWAGATSLTFSADNATVYGSDASNGDITIHGTSNATRTSSYVILQPTAGNVGIGTTAPGAVFDITKTNSAAAADYVGSLTDITQSVSGGISLYGQRIIARATHTTGTLTGLQANSTQLYFSGNGGTTTAAEGLTSIATVGTGATVSTLDLVRVYSPVNSGTITNLRGIHIHSMTAGGTSNYSIYSEGGQMYHAGNIGIGTTSTDSLLHISGSGRDSTPNSAGIRMGMDGSSNYALEITNSGGIPHIDFQNDTSGTDYDVRLGAYGDDILALMGGNLGIGTDTPTAQLGFLGTSDQTIQVERHTTAETAGSDLTLRSGGATSGATNQPAGNLLLTTGTATGDGNGAYVSISAAYCIICSDGTTDLSPTEVVRVNRNVGIGTTGAAARLQVHNISSEDILNLYDTTTEVMTVLDGGNVGMGTSNPGAQLAVSDDLASDYVAEFFNDGNNANRLGIQVQAGADSAGTGTLVQFRDGDGTDVGEITFSGTTTTYGTSSDLRMKENIVATSRSLQDVMNITVHDFEFKDDPSDKKYTGFIAQEVVSILPEAVHSPDDGSMWSVDYGKFTPLIIKAVQDQQTQIAQLANKIENGILSLQELVVTNVATIKDLRVNTLSINNQPLSDYVAQIVRNTQPTTPELVDPQVEVVTSTNGITALGALTAESVETTTLKAETTVTDSLEVAGPATFAANITALGQITASSASISGTVVAEAIDVTSVRVAQLEARVAEFEQAKLLTAEIGTATVSGTLYATNIDGLNEKIYTALEKPSFLSLLAGQSETGQETLPEVLGAVASAHFEASSSANLNLSLADLQLETDDVTLQADALFVNTYFKVNGAAYVAQSMGVGETIFIGEKASVGSDFIAYQADTPEDTFAVQPSGKGTLTLMAGLLTLNETGTVTVNGDFIATGDVTVKETLFADLLKSTELGNPLQVQVAGINDANEVKESRFEIVDELGTPVATISAEGRAAFAGGIAIGSEDLGASSISDVPTLESQKTSGKALLKSGTKEVKIFSDKIGPNSLVYVTPVGSTGNKVMYVTSQEAHKPGENIRGNFVVGFDEVLEKDVHFNWWIVN